MSRHLSVHERSVYSEVTRTVGTLYILVPPPRIRAGRHFATNGAVPPRGYIPYYMTMQCSGFPSTADGLLLSLMDAFDAGNGFGCTKLVALGDDTKTGGGRPSESGVDLEVSMGKLGTPAKQAASHAS